MIARPRSKGPTTELQITRRDVLASAGGLLFSLTLRPLAGQTAKQNPLELSAWVLLNRDNTMTIYNPSAEMGQGAMTAMPLIFAEELDADWSLVDVQYSPIRRETYGRRRQGGLSMSTTGSNSLSSFFMPLRRLGAQARRVLMENTAQYWRVPISELRTEPSVVIHGSTGRHITYGEIAGFARIPPQPPEITDDDLKPIREFRLIGHSQPRRDVPEKIDGSAQFAMDARVPGMRYGMILRAPINGSKPVWANDEVIMAQAGVTDIVYLDHGVGVVGESVNAVLKSRKLLDVMWSGGAPAEGFDSDQAFAIFSEIASGATENGSAAPGQGRGNVQEGDVPSALAAAAKTYRREYLSDHLYHAQMEPLSAVASVATAGDSAEIWIGSQSPDDAGDAVAAVLDIPSQQVTVNQHYLGGGFGRRTINDEAVEAALLSRAAKKPVKLIWSREDDLRSGAFRPMSLQRLEAGVDDRGDLVAWRHYVVGDGDELQITGVDIPFYAVENKDIRPIRTSTGVRLRHWRAVGHGCNKFAIESFLDEIAEDQGVDPIEFHRRLMRGSPRELELLDAIAEVAGWGSAVAGGRARGFAFAERSNSTSAGIAEISVDEVSGKIRVHHFWVAVDAGIVVQPDIVLAQVEGAVTQGISSLLNERISIKDGRVEQSNFHDYRVLTMADSFPITVKLMRNEHQPTGVGEAGLPATGGAVANAFAKLTGKRLRHMPFTPDRVLAALRS